MNDPFTGRFESFRDNGVLVFTVEKATDLNQLYTDRRNRLLQGTRSRWKGLTQFSAKNESFPELTSVAEIRV